MFKKHNRKITRGLCIALSTLAQKIRSKMKKKEL